MGIIHSNLFSFSEKVSVTWTKTVKLKINHFRKDIALNGNFSTHTQNQMVSRVVLKDLFTK